MQRHTRFPRPTSTVTTNPIISLFSSQHNVTSSFDSFLAFIVILEDNLHIFVYDFNHAPTLALTVFDLTDLRISPNRGALILGRVITNHRNLFPLKLRVPASCYKHRLDLLRPKIHSRSDFNSLKQTNQIQICIGDFFHNSLTLLQKSFSHATACFSFELLLNDNVRFFTETAKTIFGICCHLETPFVSNGSISTQIMRRRKKHFYKSRNDSMER